MPFQHLAGVTTPGAPDEVVDWFATFEAWISGVVGWTVVAGAGTTDLVISSVGEGAAYTMLFVRVYRDGINPNWIRGDVRNDALGTQTTTNLGWNDSGGVQFAFWMSADLDAICIVWKTGANYRSMYLGCLMPFALAPVDETYYMVATDGLLASAILRNHNGLWDQNIVNYHDSMSDNLNPCALDGAFPLMALVANDQDEIAGEFRFISGLIGPTVAVTQEDTVQTGYPGATSEWIVLSHWTSKFALRTGGVEPTGLADGAAFASQAGVTANQTNFITVDLAGFLTGIGWTDMGAAPGVPAPSRLFYSQGESGAEDIYCIVAHAGAINGYWYLMVQDDAVGTNRTPYTFYAQMNPADFPANYFISGDLDCFVFATQRGIGAYDPCWLGMVVAFNANLPSTDYKLCTHARGLNKHYLLRGHDNVYDKVCVWNYGSDPLVLNSQPNLFDGTTYFVWPSHLEYGIAGAIYEGVGMCKYLMKTVGGGIAQLDTITVGAQVYTVLFDSGNIPMAIRTT